MNPNLECERLGTHAEIDLDAIAHNLNSVRKLLNPQVLIMAVLKGDAYGHGLVPVARKIAEIGVERIGVARLCEALEIVNAGISKKIHILTGVLREEVQALVQHRNLIPTVYTYEIAKEISKQATRAGKMIQIHIKIDTGMHRYGFMLNEAHLIELIAKIPGIEVEGIYSHLSSAASTDKSIAINQVDLFEQLVKSLERHGLRFPLKHISSSAGLLFFPELQFNMVRIASLIFGYYPTDKARDLIDIGPTLTFKSKVIQLKEVEGKSFVGYGKSFYTERPIRVAMVPCGYGDGLNRRLSSFGSVLIRGQYARFAGRIMMDTSIVDVSSIPDVSVGDEVVIVGRQQNSVIDVNGIVRKLETGIGDFYAGITKRVPRVYVGSSQ